MTAPEAAQPQTHSAKFKRLSGGNMLRAVAAANTAGRRGSITQSETPTLSAGARSSVAATAARKSTKGSVR